jgi:integrase
MERQRKTVRQIFTEWLQEKKEYGEIQKSTCDRYEADFIKFFSEFGNLRIDEVTENDLERFIKGSINKYNLTNKAYSGLRLLLLGIFTYAKKHKLTDISIQMFFRELCLSSKLFRKTKKKAEDNVFMADEVERIIKHLMDNRPNVISYGIVVALRTGLRVGELCALKAEDIHPGYIDINKTEIRYRVDAGHYTREVRVNAKTDAGNRQVIIDSQTEELIREIRRLNPNGEYLFESDGKRCIGSSFTKKLERACNTIGIKPRSMHKCRKTYATNLINANVPESLIIAQMGHIDIKTTRQYYLYNNTAKDKAIATLSAALSSNQNNQA